MKNFIQINKKINNFRNKEIFVTGDKSLSIRFVILSSLAKGKSIAKNILASEDVINAIKCIKKLGIKINLKKNYCEVFGKGLWGYKYKDNLLLNAGNSGTAARLLCAAIIDSKNKIKITGDNSLKKRDMLRIINPLQEIGLRFEKNNGRLPLTVNGSKNLTSIKYLENLGSAQCKSAVMIAALKVPGVTNLKCLPSRNHTELLFKNVLKLPIITKKEKGYDIIQINGLNNFKSFKYKIPGDISSASFFIVLTLLSKNSSLIIKETNINPTRIGIINILNKMGANIFFKNKKVYNGEEIADIHVSSITNLKSINLNPKLNSSAIDEFLLIFLVAAVCKGKSKFSGLEELNKKESKRLDWGYKILKMMGVRVKKIDNSELIIWGNPKLELKNNFVIKNFLKDHRIFMLTVIAALTLGGNWKIYNPESVKTSFPTFLKIIKNLGGKIS